MKKVAYPIFTAIVVTVTTTLANGQTAGVVNVIYQYGTEYNGNCEGNSCNTGTGNGNTGNDNGKGNEACRSLGDLGNAWLIYAWVGTVTGITGLAFML